ncbi:MAG: hypothetical protein NT168_03850 [Planctomycetota bacterium]|nr:hypothetical protein [Planctomycetota bacterium]
MTKPTCPSFYSASRLPLLFAAVLLVPGIGPWAFGVPSALRETENQQQSDEKGSESPLEKPQDQEPQVAREAARGATLIRVPLPLSSDADTRILASLESVAMRSDGNQRPVVILEFVSASVPSGPAAADANGALEPPGESKSIGQGTPFEKALSVSRWLSGPKGNRVKSVGYIASNLRGHAVLIALACEEKPIWTSPLGAACSLHRPSDRCLTQANRSCNWISKEAASSTRPFQSLNPNHANKVHGGNGSWSLQTKWLRSMAKSCVRGDGSQA